MYGILENGSLKVSVLLHRGFSCIPSVTTAVPFGLVKSRVKHEDMHHHRKTRPDTIKVGILPAVLISRQLLQMPYANGLLPPPAYLEYINVLATC